MHNAYTKSPEADDNPSDWQRALFWILIFLSFHSKLLCKRSPFLKCVVCIYGHIWKCVVSIYGQLGIAYKGGWGCKGLPGWFGALFSTFARLTEEGGLKLFGQCPYRTNTFQKGASLRDAVKNYLADSFR